VKISVFVTFIAVLFVIISATSSYSTSNTVKKQGSYKIEKRIIKSTGNATKNSKVKEDINNSIPGKSADITFEGC